MSYRERRRRQAVRWPPHPGGRAILLLPLLLTACARPASPCDCELGHGFQLAGSELCQCVPPVEAEAPPAPATTFEVGPAEEVDWTAVDEALASGHVTVLLSGTREERLEILRTDEGPHRLTIDGGEARAVVPGVLTGYEGPPRHRVTLRRLEITGSRDKGVFWWAGDEIVLEDLVVHGNRGSPAIALEYANRSGYASTSFVLRNSHIYDQTGECVYIGGSEGTDQDAHAAVTVEGNLIHDCRHAFSGKTDGINIKDRIGFASVRRNVVFHTHWGIELASPGLYEENLVFATESNGLHFNDVWGEGFDEVRLEDNAVIDPGEAGVRISADERPTDGLQIERTLIVGARRAGVVLAGGTSLRATIAGLHVEATDQAFEGWGDIELDLSGCTLHDVGERADEATSPDTEGCETAISVGDLSVLSGPDLVFFTEDDPWWPQGLPEAAQAP